MQDQESWAARWLDSVADGSAKMSQRSRASIDRNGGIDAIIMAAQERRLHLAQLTDDEGKVVVAASRDPIETLC